MKCIKYVPERTRKIYLKAVFLINSIPTSINVQQCLNVKAVISISLVFILLL